MDDLLLAKLPSEQSPRTILTPSRPSDGRVEGYRRQLVAVGIPVRYRVAHLPDCDVYADDEAKVAALAGAREFISDHDRQALVLAGPNGSGKTWLATAVFKQLLWQDKEARATWVKAYQLLREVQSGYRDGTADSVLARYQARKLLLIDDLGDVDQSPSTDRSQIIYELLDTRHSNMLPTIVTTNLDKDGLIESYGERLFNRLLEMSCFVWMAGRNYRVNPLPEQPNSRAAEEAVTEEESETNSQKLFDE